jgi:steroid 5-alpha reductase family enzyme
MLFGVFGAMATMCFTITAATNSCLFRDLLFPFAPLIYGCVFYNRSYGSAMALACIFIWCVRLNFNYFRKQKLSLTHDYRWDIVFKDMTKMQRLFFTFGIIGVYNNVMYSLMALPVMYSSNVGWKEALAFLVFLSGITIETVADQQQYEFHSDLKLKRKFGFLKKGLFQYSRHPNYFGDVIAWVGINMFSNPRNAYEACCTFMGITLYTVFIHGSISITEAVSAKKYPKYTQYQKETSAFLMTLPKFSKTS